MGAPTNILFEALRYILAEGIKFGFNLNPAKGCLLLAKCETNAEAYDKKNLYMSTFGLAEEIIRIHPDNLHIPTLNYGAKFLGTFFGQADYIENELQKKAQKLIEIKDAIVKFPDKQIK